MYSSLIFLGLCLSRLHARPIFKSDGAGTSAFRGCPGIFHHEKYLSNEEEEFGWLGVGKPIEYLKSHDSLTKPIRVEELDDYVPNVTQEQNMARWALRQAIKQPVPSLIPVKEKSSEVFTALIWLIGIAEGKSEEWTLKAKRWADYDGELPYGRERVARFHTDFERDYEWLERSRAEGWARAEDSDVTATAIYLGSVLFSKGKAKPGTRYYYKSGLEPMKPESIKPKGSVFSSLK
ncbi:uncharacterized protein MELLADRAFT_35858 [Melampsora larici-populina 98AG31]|uniref:Secreted protein n=1 Tax=Melampsora larici-populina (strain 98AG31 / pathotype 3-4-7) TaxID=747676 RepID=F4RL11_MELLP|nr:uncharacterized protein MELLADRAFT_35858 [Melampsora larici-populina 98AG31]EGG06819.1 secreted protein [Melampsora larici-populina 98AG31]